MKQHRGKQSQENSGSGHPAEAPDRPPGLSRHVSQFVPFCLFELETCHFQKHHSQTFKWTLFSHLTPISSAQS